MKYILYLTRFKSKLQHLKCDSVITIEQNAMVLVVTVHVSDSFLRAAIAHLMPLA